MKLKLLALLSVLTGSQLWAIIPVVKPVNTFLSVFENKSNTDFKMFVGIGRSRFLLAHTSCIDLSKAHGKLKDSIRVSDGARVDMVDVSGTNQSIYIKFGGYASGPCNGAKTPFYLEIWREFPDAPQLHRTYVRYTQSANIGHLGLRISQNSSPEIFAVGGTRIVS